MECSGTAGHGRLVSEWLGTVRKGMARQSGCGMAQHDSAGLGRRGLEWVGKAGRGRLGFLRHGTARRGSVRPLKVELGGFWLGRHGWVGPDLVWLGRAGVTWHG